MNIKESKQLYKEREIIGGVFGITCKSTKHTLIQSSKDIEAQVSKFTFVKQAFQSVEAFSLKLKKDNDQYGCDNFTFTLYERLKKSDEQSDAQFKADLKLLEDVYKEELSSKGELLY